MATLWLILLLCAALAAFAAGLGGWRRRRADPLAAAKLPDRAALERAAARGDANVVVARFAARDSDPIDADAAASLVRRTAERLRSARVASPLFHTGDGGLAWLERPGDEHSLDDRVDALAAAMLAPLDGGRVIDVSLSFGLATADCGAGGRQRIDEAGAAARAALAQGELWRRHAPVARPALAGELDGAVATGQLWNAYLPLVDIASGGVAGAVVLPRWMHPRLGPVPPAEFLPDIAAGGRSATLVRALLTMALDDQAGWRADGFDLPLMLDLPAALLGDHLFAETAGQLLTASRRSASPITLAIDAGALLRSGEAAAALAGWRAAGGLVAIAGFGADPAADEAALAAADPRLALLDDALVHACAIDERAGARLAAAAALAQAHALPLCAPGVHDRDTLTRLTPLGCRLATGDLFGRPMPADAIAGTVGPGARAAA